MEDLIDHGAGVLIHRKPGDVVQAGEPILDLLYNHDRSVRDAIGLASSAIDVSDAPPPIQPLVLGSVGSVRPRS